MPTSPIPHSIICNRTPCTITTYTTLDICTCAHYYHICTLQSRKRLCRQSKRSFHSVCNIIFRCLILNINRILYRLIVSTHSFYDFANSLIFFSVYVICVFWVFWTLFKDFLCLCPSLCLSRISEKLRPPNNSLNSEVATPRVDSLSVKCYNYQDPSHFYKFPMCVLCSVMCLWTHLRFWSQIHITHHIPYISVMRHSNYVLYYNEFYFVEDVYIF